MLTRFDLEVDPAAAGPAMAAERAIPPAQAADEARAAVGDGLPRRVAFFLADAGNPAHDIFRRDLGHWRIALPRTRPSVWRQATTATLRRAIGDPDLPKIDVYGGRIGRRTLLLAPDADLDRLDEIRAANDPEVERTSYRLVDSCHLALIGLSAHALLALRRAAATRLIEIAGHPADRQDPDYRHIHPSAR